MGKGYLMKKPCGYFVFLKTSGDCKSPATAFGLQIRMSGILCSGVANAMPEDPRYKR